MVIVSPVFGGCGTKWSKWHINGGYQLAKWNDLPSRVGFSGGEKRGVLIL